MKATIDVSMYPNREDFIPPIDGFIERMGRYDGLTVRTFPTSTVVQGEYGDAMRAVGETIAACRAAYGMAAASTPRCPQTRVSGNRCQHSTSDSACAT